MIWVLMKEKNVVSKDTNLFVVMMMMSTRHMCQLFIDHMNTAFEKWTPRERYEVFKV